MFYFNCAVWVFFAFTARGKSIEIDVQDAKDALVLTKELISNLYEKYKDAVMSGIEVGTVAQRRMLSEGREFDIHVKKLKEVNGLKSHNLVITENREEGPLIYINNPLEARVPNAFLTEDEFKKELEERALRSRNKSVKKKQTQVLPEIYATTKVIIIEPERRVVVGGSHGLSGGDSHLRSDRHKPFTYTHIPPRNNHGHGIYYKEKDNYQPNTYKNKFQQFTSAKTTNSTKTTQKHKDEKIKKEHTHETSKKRKHETTTHNHSKHTKKEVTTLSEQSSKDHLRHNTHSHSTTTEKTTDADKSEESSEQSAEPSDETSESKELDLNNVLRIGRDNETQSNETNMTNEASGKKNITELDGLDVEIVEAILNKDTVDTTSDVDTNTTTIVEAESKPPNITSTSSRLKLVNNQQKPIWMRPRYTITKKTTTSTTTRRTLGRPLVFMNSGNVKINT